MVADPDRSNPTRPRLERPLDTIRSFEAAIDGKYGRVSSYSGMISAIGQEGFQANSSSQKHQVLADQSALTLVWTTLLLVEDLLVSYITSFNVTAQSSHQSFPYWIDYCLFCRNLYSNVICSFQWQSKLQQQ